MCYKLSPPYGNLFDRPSATAKGKAESQEDTRIRVEAAVVVTDRGEPPKHPFGPIGELVKIRTRPAGLSNNAAGHIRPVQGSGAIPTRLRGGVFEIGAFHW